MVGPGMDASKDSMIWWTLAETRNFVAEGKSTLGTCCPVSCDPAALWTRCLGEVFESVDVVMMSCRGDWTPSAVVFKDVEVSAVPSGWEADVGLTT